MLPPKLEKIRERWLEVVKDGKGAGRHMQDVIYSRDFGKPFASLFSKLPVYGYGGKFPQTKYLVSTLGMSWQPAALLAARLKPEKLLIIGTKESLAIAIEGEDVIETIARISGLDRERISVEKAKDPLERSIYKLILEFVRDNGIGRGELVIDPTAGKKSMSAAAALAGYILGAKMLYVDYAEYFQDGRIPVAGSEYPRLLTNPLVEFGTLELDKIELLFNSGQFDQACRVASEFEQNSHEPRLGEALRALCAGYGDWNRFRFADAMAKLGELKLTIEKFQTGAEWKWARKLQAQLEMHLEVLNELSALRKRSESKTSQYSAEEASLVIANHIEAAERALKAGQFSASLLLAYSSVERAVAFALHICHGIDSSKFKNQLSIEEVQKFHEAGQSIYGKDYDESKGVFGKLGFSQSLALLCAKDEKLFAKIKPECRKIYDLMNKRNECEYEHGLVPRAVDKEKAKKLFNTALSAVKTIADVCDFSLKSSIKKVKFPLIEL